MSCALSKMSAVNRDLDDLIGVWARYGTLETAVCNSASCLISVQHNLHVSMFIYALSVFMISGLYIINRVRYVNKCY